MTKHRNKRPVQIFDARTGAARLSEPMPVQTARQGNDPAPAEPLTPVAPLAAPEASVAALHSVSTSEAPEPEVAKAGVQASVPDTAAAQQASGTPRTAGPESSGGAPATKASKPDIETLEQFIEYAYGRKGKPVVLKPKLESKLAQNPRLDEAGLSRLQTLAKGDVLLAVPRQLLLLSRDIQGSPGLRAALVSFVSNVMLRHAAFDDAGVQAAVRNLPEGLPATQALTQLMGFTPQATDDAAPLKGAELQTLRHNAAHLFVTWLAVNRGLSFEELAALLFQAMWLPAAKALPDDTARLRALTEVEHTAGVGLACQRFRQQANEARAQQDQAQREATDLRDRVAQLEERLSASEAQRDALQADLTALRKSAAAEREGLRQQQLVESTHLQHALEQLRGRLVKRLTDSVDMLEVGLSALRKEEPRVPVMVERAEHVVDALRAEIRDLREE